jgi:5-hydroxyisourate hydrolase
VSGITSHVLDTARGRPAAGVGVGLDVAEGNGWREVGSGRTDADGRVTGLVPSHAELVPGSYRLRFEVGAYFLELGADAFYPRVVVEFEVRDGFQHYHVPLLLSPFGYSTYRGS